MPISSPSTTVADAVAWRELRRLGSVASATTTGTANPQAQNERFLVHRTGNLGVTPESQ
jgi:hypothetical protein